MLFETPNTSLHICIYICIGPAMRTFRGISAQPRIAVNKLGETLHYSLHHFIMWHCLQMFTKDVHAFDLHPTLSAKSHTFIYIDYVTFLQNRVHCLFGGNYHLLVHWEMYRYPKHPSNYFLYDCIKQPCVIPCSSGAAIPSERRIFARVCALGKCFGYSTRFRQVGWPVQDFVDTQV